MIIFLSDKCKIGFLFSFIPSCRGYRFEEVILENTDDILLISEDDTEYGYIGMRMQYV